MKLYLKKYESYESDYSLSDAIAGLSGKVKSGNWLNWLQGGIFGSVKSDSVILRYYRLYYRPLNFLSLGISFKGSFTEQHGVTTLKGRFSLPMVTRAFMSSWLILTVFLLFYSLSNIDLLPIPFFLFLVWFANIFLINRLGKSDIQRVSQMLSDALKPGAKI